LQNDGGIISEVGEALAALAEGLDNVLGNPAAGFLMRTWIRMH
jgi:hypothetical protein